MRPMGDLLGTDSRSISRPFSVPMPRRGWLGLLGWMVVGLLAAPALAEDGDRSSVSEPSAFDKNFVDSTLRLDLFHTGDAEQEIYAVNSVRIEGIWAGSRTQLVDPADLGPFRFEVRDAVDESLLYSRGYATLFGEWRTTAEAKERSRTFAESLRFPEPKGPVSVHLLARDATQRFRPVWSTVVDPAGRFVVRRAVSAVSAVEQQTVWTLLENGDPAVKVDLLFLGDGYQKDELGAFREDAKRLTEALFRWAPFADRKADFNVRAIAAPASESGVTIPRAGVFRASPLATRYDIFDSERYLLSEDEFAWRNVAAAAPYDAVILLANSRKYGGGGLFNLYAAAAARSEFADYLVVHEFGHSFAGLGDEYYTSPVSYLVEEVPADGKKQALTEPWEHNLTALGDPKALKWGHLATPGIDLPTKWIKAEYDQLALDFQRRREDFRKAGASEEALEALFEEQRISLTALLDDSNASGGGEGRDGRRVGAFEGAGYRSRGLYRPAMDCLMFTRDEVGFCPVCEEALSQVIDLYTR